MHQNLFRISIMDVCRTRQFWDLKRPRSLSSVNSWKGDILRRIAVHASIAD